MRLRTSVLGAVLACLTGCGGAAPAEFATGCGHPGSTIVVNKVPVTVKHRDCDLTGVTIQVGANGTGALVPGRGEEVKGQGDAPGGYPPPAGVDISVDAKTGDVTVSSH